MVEEHGLGSNWQAEGATCTGVYAGLDPDGDWEVLWARLMECGWRSVPGKRRNRPNDCCFLPPGVTHAGKPFRSRIDYFDSFRSVREAVFRANGRPSAVRACTQRPGQASATVAQSDRSPSVRANNCAQRTVSSTTANSAELTLLRDSSRCAQAPVAAAPKGQPLVGKAIEIFWVVSPLGDDCQRVATDEVVNALVKDATGRTDRRPVGSWYPAHVLFAKGSKVQVRYTDDDSVAWCNLYNKTANGYIPPEYWREVGNVNEPLPVKLTDSLVVGGIVPEVELQAFAQNTALSQSTLKTYLKCIREIISKGSLLGLANGAFLAAESTDATISNSERNMQTSGAHRSSLRKFLKFLANSNACKPSVESSQEPKENDKLKQPLNSAEDSLTRLSDCTQDVYDTSGISRPRKRHAVVPSTDAAGCLPAVCRSARGNSAAAASAGERVSSNVPVTKLKIGDRVSVRFKRGGWFNGTLVRRVAEKKFRVLFDDNDVFVVDWQQDEVVMLSVSETPTKTSTAADRAAAFDDSLPKTLELDGPTCNAERDGVECAVCFEKIAYMHNDTCIFTLGCGHIFCGHCIQQWFEQDSKRSCPSCRRSFASLRHCKQVRAAEFMRRKTNAVNTLGCDMAPRLKHLRSEPSANDHPPSKRKKTTAQSQPAISGVKAPPELASPTASTSAANEDESDALNRQLSRGLNAPTRRVNALWTQEETEHLLRMVEEQGIGDWQAKAELWRKNTRQHHAKQGGLEPTKRTAKSIEAKWYKELRKSRCTKVAHQSSTIGTKNKGQVHPDVVAVVSTLVDVLSEEQEDQQQRLSRGGSCYRGLHWDANKGLWQVNISMEDSTNQHVGQYPGQNSEVKAALAFDVAARRFRGKLAHGGRREWRLNFPSAAERRLLVSARLNLLPTLLGRRSRTVKALGKAMSLRSLKEEMVEKQRLLLQQLEQVTALLHKAERVAVELEQEDDEEMRRVLRIWRHAQ